jgi:hypothetical protein
VCVLRYKRGGRGRDCGRWPDISLAMAREPALAPRRKLYDGTDTIDGRRAQRQAAKREGAKKMTFKQCAEAHIAAHRDGWRSEVYALQWKTALLQYAYPVIASLPVAAIDTGLVLRVLEPIWTSKTVTASNLRGRYLAGVF